MNIRKKDLSVFLNHAGAIVLSTVHNGYYVSRTYYDISLKWARVEFINELKVKKNAKNFTGQNPILLREKGTDFI